MLAQAEAADLRKQMEELRTQLQRNEEMVRWLNNQVRGQQARTSQSAWCRHSSQRSCYAEQSAAVILRDLRKQALASSPARAHGHDLISTSPLANRHGYASLATDMLTPVHMTTAGERGAAAVRLRAGGLEIFVQAGHDAGCRACAEHARHAAIHRRAIHIGNPITYPITMLPLRQSDSKFRHAGTGASPYVPTHSHSAAFRYMPALLCSLIAAKPVYSCSVWVRTALAPRT